MPSERIDLEKNNREIKGIIITFIAGVLWGMSGTCAQFLFREYGITPIYLTTIRQLYSGIILSGVVLAKHRDKLKAILTKPRNLTILLLFALLGLLFNQLSYLETISHTNSGTATILQYIGPVLIVVINCIIQKRPPKPREIIAVILVIIGTFLIATHGDVNSLYITPIGLVWGLLSALALVFYTMIPVPLIKEYGSIPVVGSSMFIAGIIMVMAFRFSGGPKNPDATYYIMISLIVLLGTIMTYVLYLTGVSLCGPVKGSLAASSEPVSATICMVVWLHEPFYGIEFIGFLCIFITVFLLAKKD